MMRRLCLLLCLVPVSLTAGLTGSSSATAILTECPHSGILRDGSLVRRGLTCHKARRLVLHFMRGSQDRGPRFKVEGFRCRNAARQSGVVCRRGTKLARFLGTPDWL